jgi:hypothetical protein
MVLENVKEMWTEAPRTAGGKKGKPVAKDRFVSKMCAFRGPKSTANAVCMGYVLDDADWLQVPSR